jgi:hypothetical protein
MKTRNMTSATNPLVPWDAKAEEQIAELGAAAAEKGLLAHCTDRRRAETAAKAWILTMPGGPARRRAITEHAMLLIEMVWEDEE